MPMIGTSEAARRLGVSPRRVAAMIEQGVLRAQKIGKTWVIDETEVAKVAKAERKPGRPRKTK
jgi:excisionase family DNA binding protein